MKGGAGLWLLAGCSTTVVGTVVDKAGKPVAGATVHADGQPPCDAVTDAEGRFKARCPAGERSFTVSHPGALPRSEARTVEGTGEVALAPFQLSTIPLDPGVFVLLGQAYVPLPPGPLRRLGDEKSGWRWCFDTRKGAPLDVPAGDLSLLDNHVADWRVLKLDAEGCAYRLSPGSGDYWTDTVERVEVVREAPLAEGRDRLKLTLAAGDYAVVDWFATGLVPAGPPEGDWRGSWLRAK